MMNIRTYDSDRAVRLCNCSVNVRSIQEGPEAENLVKSKIYPTHQTLFRRPKDIALSRATRFAVGPADRVHRIEEMRVSVLAKYQLLHQDGSVYSGGLQSRANFRMRSA